MSVNPELLNGFQSKPQNEQELILQEIRLSIIGDEDEKLILLNSEYFVELFNLFDKYVSAEESNSKIFQHLLIIISSLSYLPVALSRLINQYNILNKLVVVANFFNEDNGILSIIFKLLSNILSLKHDLNLELNSHDGYLFKELLLNKIDCDNTDNYKIINENEILLNIFTLIPHLNPLELKTMINPSLRILEIVLNKPTNFLLAKYSKMKLYIECFDSLIVPNPPPLVLFSNLTAPLLYTLSHLLYYDEESLMKTLSSEEDRNDALKELNQKNKIDKSFNKNLYFTITSLLKSSDFELKLSAISILINFSLNSSLSESEKNRNVRKFLPYLIQLIDLDESNNLIVFKSELKLSRRFNPFYILSKLCLSFEFVNDYLLNCNIIKNFCEIITKFNNQDFETLSLLKLDNLSDLFLILSSITSNSEQNRNLIIKHDLSVTIKKILEFHHANIVQYIKDGKSCEDEKELEELIIASNHLTVSTCYLLRSLSRSVSILRSYLYETNIVDNLLNILKIPENSFTKIQNKNLIIIKSEILLKTVILSILSNLVLDFSPLRNDLLNNNLIDIVSELLLTTNHNSIKSNCLWVIRHIIYNETPINRDKSIEKIGIQKILQFCNDEDLNIKQQAFNVLRNLTCSSKLHVNKLLNNFLDNNKENYFFQFIYEKLININIKDSRNDGLLESIIFIIVHIAAISEIKRELIIKNQLLLTKIGDILIYSENTEVKLACIWLIINLTWIENVSNSNGAFRGDFTPTASRSVNFFEDQDIIDEDEDVDVEEEEEDDDDEDEEINLHSVNTNTPRRILRSQTNLNNNSRNSRNFETQGDLNINGDANASKRATILNKIGFTKILSDLLDNENIDLRERVRTALFNLNQFNTRGGAN